MTRCESWQIIATGSAAVDPKLALQPRCLQPQKSGQLYGAHLDYFRDVVPEHVFDPGLQRRG
jgi:hypothetical protein